MALQPGAVPPSLEPGELPPKTVAWLQPTQLLHTAYRVWLSTIAKEYVDRRETLAALDAVRSPREGFPATALRPCHFIDAAIPDAFHDQSVWIDFVADIGDSWNATYAVAKLSAAPSLQLQGHRAPLDASNILVLGGDLVYPTPTRESYRRKMRAPLIAARPTNASEPAPCLLAIPGNHDWYDGLTNFVREFCQGGELGGWSMVQRRSYFAVKLIAGWWLWGIDIALDTRIDPPQQAYFLRVLQNATTHAAERFTPGDNIILCTSRPAWLDRGGTSSDAYVNLNHFVGEIVEQNGGCVRVILAGDVHHYSRYENRRGDHLIAAGGGGAYLQATHHLPSQVADVSASPREPQAAAYHDAGFPYPSRRDSRRLALGAALLAFRPANVGFDIVIGGFYVLFSWAIARTVPLAGVSIAAVLFATVGCALVAAASNSSSRRWLTVPWGIAHGVLHLLLALFLAGQIGRLVASPAVFSAVLILVGGVLGATLVGTYFVLSDFLFGWHTNEAFAVQSIVDYRNFVRLHLRPDGALTIYPIGLRRVPAKWRFALNRQDHEPYYEPTDAILAPHLIEGPIEIARRRESRLMS